MADTPAAPDFRETIKHLPKGAWFSLWLLIVINLFNYIDRYNLSAVETNIREEFFTRVDPTTQERIEAGNAKALTGNLALAFMAAYMVFAPLFGWFGDRYSRWVLIGIGIAVWTAATGASGLATTYWALFAARCFVGVGEAAYGPAAPAIIADLFPVQHRGKAISWFYAAIPVGSALGFTLGGVIAEWLGWRWAFYLMVPPGIFLAIWCFFLKDPPRGQTETAGSGFDHRPGFADYWKIMTNRSFIWDTAALTAMAFAVGGVTFWMPTYVYEFRLNKTVSQGTVSSIFGGIVVVSGLFSTLLGGWLGDYFRNRGMRGAYSVVSGMGMFLGFGFFLAVLYVPFPLAWVFLFLAVFCLFLNTGPGNTILANVIHPVMRPMAVALNIFFIHALGDAFSPMIIGAVADNSTGGLQTGFFFVSGFIVLSGICWIVCARYEDEDTKNAPFMLEQKS